MPSNRVLEISTSTSCDRWFGVPGFRHASALGWLLALGLPACASGAPPDPGPEPEAAQEYFTVVRDVRRCASPLCGGYFIEAVNDPLTTCADGRREDRCYVADIEWGPLGEPSFEAAVTLVHGALAPRAFEGFGNLGELTARQVWVSASALEPLGRFVRLFDNGVRCVTFPCFSTGVEVLNDGGAIEVSGFDLSGAEAPPAAEAEAGEAYLEGTLIAAGTLRTMPQQGPAGDGTDFVASQFFLPERGAASANCLSDADCSAGEACNVDLCLPPPGCRPGSICPAVCAGLCEPVEPPRCESDSDCPADRWCRFSRVGASSCVPFVGEGASCEGFTLPELFERCAPDLVCDTPPFIADVPGICRRPCAAASHCEPAEYCSVGGVCRADGSCQNAFDCGQPGNAFARILCIGALVCSDEFLGGGRCGVECGLPEDADICGDLAERDFGPCEAVLGWGVVNNQCTLISGCNAGDPPLFASRELCEERCGAGGYPPARAQ